VQQLELFAERVRSLAGIGDDEVVDAAEFAERLLGRDSIVIVDHLHCGARLRRTPAGYCIELQDGLEDMNFAAAHEVAHWALRTLEQYEGPDEERFANYVGAALLAPRAIVRAAAGFFGRRLEAIDPLATSLYISRTAANLRLGEVLGDERVVVTKSGNVLRSSEEAFAQPDALVVKLARSLRSAPGVVKARLTGGIDDQRVALRAR
jgi:hypothetical protein